MSSLSSKAKNRTPKPIDPREPLPGSRPISESAAESNPPRERNAPIYVKVLLTIHILAIVCWSMPTAPDDKYPGNNRPPFFDVGDWIRLYNGHYPRKIPLLQAYLFETGTWQYWDMFAPNPMSRDTFLDAEILYKNGAHKYYLYPRMFALPLANKYAQERYRKYAERAGTVDYKQVWPQFALRIAYLNDDLKNPPVTVRLYAHTLDIAPPGKPQPVEYSKSMYYEYAVDPMLLGRMRSQG